MASDYQPLYVLASGMLLQERKLDVITNNLANTNTTAFKKDLLLINAWYTNKGSKVQTDAPEHPSNNFVYPMILKHKHDLSEGTIKYTKNKFDIALIGEGFLGVKTPEGTVYTKKGRLALDHEGFLTTEEGYRVVDDVGNEIFIGDGDMTVDKEGNIYINNEFIGRLGLWKLENPEKVGHGFFKGRAELSDNTQVEQGFIETSNVNPVEEMAKLIETSRAHEVYSRLIQAIDEVQNRVNTIAT